MSFPKYLQLVLDLGVTPGPNISIAGSEPDEFAGSSRLEEEIRLDKAKEIQEMTATTDALVEIVADYLGIDKANVKTDQDFKDMGFDSLDLMDMLMQVEEKFDVKLNITEDTNNIDKLAELVEATKNA